VISGGTEQGISGIVGAMAEKRVNIQSVGYLPASLPPDGSASRDERYKDLRDSKKEKWGDLLKPIEVETAVGTARHVFSPIEPLQYWIDIVASGIDPKDVRVLGINGGEITAFEYRLAALLGATVGVVRHSGREADRLAVEEEWEQFPILMLPEDPLTFETLIHDGKTVRGQFTAAERVKLAKGCHKAYCEIMLALGLESKALVAWRKLKQQYRNSSLQQAGHITAKLTMLGLEAVRVKRGRKPRVMRLSRSQIERGAAMEHARWNIERLKEGWRLGKERDAKAKRSPYLVPWDELTNDVKEIDRVAVKIIPQLLAGIHYEIRRRP
jgi:hypothetical protein